MPALSEQEEFEFRARAEQEAQGQSKATAQKPSLGQRSMEYLKGGSYLPAVGATIGGVAGSELGPGAIGTAALGGGAGESLRQIIQRMRGKESPQTSTEALKGIGGQAALSAAGEGAGQAAGKVIGPLWNVIKKPIGSGMSKVGETMTGVPARQFGRLWKDPKALYRLKTLGQAGDEFGAALKKEGIDVTPTTAEVNDPQLATARKNVKGFFDKLKNGVKTGIEVPSFKARQVEGAIPKDFEPIQFGDKGTVKPFSSQPTASMTPLPKPTIKATVEPQEFVGKYQPSPADILKARRGTDRIIAGTPWKDKTGLHNLYKQRSNINEMFENASGPGAAASKDYARSALASNFRKLLPETQTGKISYVKSILAPLAMRAAVLGSPALAGLITSGASLASDSPIVRSAILQALIRVRGTQQGQSQGQPQ